MAYLGRKGATAPLTSADIPNDSITAAKIVDDAVDSEHYVAGSVDSAHLHTIAVFASGTKMIFNQTAAPTGWTKVTGSGNDTALRVTTGTVGTGGSVAFETAFASQTATASSGAVTPHGLVISEMPIHDHAIPATAGSSGGTYLEVNASINIHPKDTLSSGGGAAHTHAFTQPTISAINLDVSYVDVIIATKD